MSLDLDIALLARVGLFQSFSSDQLRLLAFGAVREQVAQGDTLYRQGETALGGYVVSHGQIDLMLQKGKRSIVLESVMEGGLLGETALLVESKRPADAVARADTELLFISHSLFHRMLSEYPETAASLHGRISQSLRQMMAQIEQVHGQLGTIPPLADIKGLADRVESQADEDAPDAKGTSEAPGESEDETLR